MKGTKVAMISDDESTAKNGTLQEDTLVGKGLQTKKKKNQMRNQENTTKTKTQPGKTCNSYITQKENQPIIIRPKCRQ